MTIEATEIVDWQVFAKARTQLGVDFTRILGYFREDAHKAIAAIEEAIRANNATALVLPAHTLKGDSAQLGATPLALLAQHIEVVARRCVEMHDGPDELIADVVKLRPLFRATLELFDREASLSAPRRAPVTFGRKTA